MDVIIVKDSLYLDVYIVPVNLLKIAVEKV